jgi:hypothetical protein
MCFRDRIQRQDRENLFYLMQSIIIKKNKILKLTAFIKQHGIHIHRLEKKTFLLKKTDPTFFKPFLFIKY